MSKIVTGLFENRMAADKAIHELEKRGFGMDDVSMVMSQGTRGREWSVEDHSKAAEGAAAGAATGGLIGALVAGLTAVGTIATGGAGIIAAGPIVAALAGAGAGGGAGGIIGGLIGAGIPEREVELLKDELEAGKILLGVHAHDDRVSLAEEVMESAGAVSVRH